MRTYTNGSELTQSSITRFAAYLSWRVS